MPSGRSHYNITALAYDKRGRIISIGKNSYIKTHPLQAAYGARTGKKKRSFFMQKLMQLLDLKAERYIK